MAVELAGNAGAPDAGEIPYGEERGQRAPRQDRVQPNRGPHSRQNLRPPELTPGPGGADGVGGVLDVLVSQQVQYGQHSQNRTLHQDLQQKVAEEELMDLGGHRPGIQVHGRAGPGQMSGPLLRHVVFPGHKALGQGGAVHIFFVVRRQHLDIQRLENVLHPLHSLQQGVPIGGLLPLPQTRQEIPVHPLSQLGGRFTGFVE